MATVHATPIGMPRIKLSKRAVLAIAAIAIVVVLAIALALARRR